jgi:putative hydrolase
MNGLVVPTRADVASRDPAGARPLRAPEADADAHAGTADAMTEETQPRREPGTLGVSQQIADKLRQAADLLAQQGANPFRVSAYRRAADAVVHQAWDLREILDREGIGGLVALPHIGRGIAAAIVEMLRTGRWSQLDRLRGTLDPVRVFRTVPGIGPALAQRVHNTLAIDTLEALEIAAHDGRLETVSGIGPRRAATVRGALQSLLGATRVIRRAADGPGVATLLDIDGEYRQQAAAGALRTIAPRRFNPEGKAWLPVLHARRGRWHFTALYSNTARAHERGQTRDWVVVYFYDDDHREGQHTIVTETRGPLTGQRVVRGREQECLALYPRSAGGTAGLTGGNRPGWRPMTPTAPTPGEGPGQDS